MRLLMMFGPMIFRQIQKYQRSRQRNQPRQAPPQRGYGRQNDRPNDRQNEYPEARDTRGRQQPGPIEDSQPRTQYKDLNAELRAKGKVDPDYQAEENFKLKEKDIMLTKEELKHMKANAEMPGPTASAEPLPEDSDLDIEDIFLGKKK